MWVAVRGMLASLQEGTSFQLAGQQGLLSGQLASRPGREAGWRAMRWPLKMALKMAFGARWFLRWLLKPMKQMR
eukprot:13612641-Heterocapsa_arctica.AAC.1